MVGPRRPCARVWRVLSAGTPLLCGAAIVAALVLPRATILNGAARLAAGVAAAAARLPADELLRHAATFAAGIGAGWGLALWRLPARLRRRPLILADPGRPDMPFAQALGHVRATQAGAADLPSATRALLAAGARGRLAVWRHDSSGLVHRLSARQLRRAARAMAASPARLEAIPIRQLILVRAEVEALWPRLPALRQAG